MSPDFEHTTALTRRAHGDRPCVVYLFGSRAASSHVELNATVPEFREALEKEGVLLWKN